MNKKRKQHHNSSSNGGSSTNSSQESISDKICSHLKKSFNINNIRKNVKKNGIKNKCVVCEKEQVTQKQSVEKDKTSQEQSVEKDNNLQEQSIVKEISQDQTNETSESDQEIWVCLLCGEQNCGSTNKDHAQQHYKNNMQPHHIAISIKDWTIWCYECSMELILNNKRKLELARLIANEFSMATQSLKMTNAVRRKPTVALSNNINKINGVSSITNLKDVKGTITITINNFPKVMGLHNLGNTCFLNSVIQCLARTPYLVKVLENLCTPGEKVVIPGGTFKPSPNSEEIELPPIKSELERVGQFTSVLYKLLKDMQNCKIQQSFSPTELINVLKKKSMQCMDGGQHDVHEFLRHLLDVVRNEDLKRYQAIIIKELNVRNKSQETVDNIVKAKVKFYGSQINKKLLGPEPVFRGTLVSTLKCLKCTYSSQCTEPFLDLSLPVMADKPQPPAFKRKNNLFEETYDMKGNSYPSTVSNLSKHQQKKEKKAARKNRKNRNISVDHYYEDMLAKPIKIIEENGVLESDESDADIEDNIEGEGIFREVGESGYSSEKASTFSSPVSPTNYQINSNQRATTPDNLNVLVEKSPDYKSIDNLETSLYSNTVDDSALNDSIFPPMNDILPLLASDSDRHSSDSNTNHNNQELTATPVSSPVESKDSPTSSLLDIQNVPNTDKLERIDSKSYNSDDSVTNKQISSNSTVRTVSPKNKMTNGNSKKEVNVGINDITSGFSQLGITTNNHHSPTKYPRKDEYSIQSCLNEFTMLELMSGSNEVGCEKCTEAEKKIKPNFTKMVRTSHTKQYHISCVPPVLILQLKRFQAYSVSYRKVGRRVAFPMIFDLSPVCKNSKKPRIYALYGVVEHNGSTIDNGHYVAYVKTRMPLKQNDSRWSFLPARDSKNVEELFNDINFESDEATAKIAESIEPPPGKWYYVSDARVTEVDENTVHSCQAYLLFYERIL
ncbi:ubiquitin carboxyl-terminal hydrolase 16 isoform X1 [Polistes fuscatus]|uniref:ubiquitin carboxyl-terminal hydrolase 16 isoform X1 n=1 Tax=Polistes fuscatus TaxID=30207 RepID=UPI001CA95E2F|nr:ubiquitin carboxyl-terminal hydrolase 16 isoform X1 [Polistes fuscatus]